MSFNPVPESSRIYFTNFDLWRESTERLGHRHPKLVFGCLVLNEEERRVCHWDMVTHTGWVWQDSQPLAVL